MRLFWSGYEQAGSSLNLFAERYTDRSIGWLHFVIPTGWFQSLNPVYIIIFAPFFAWLWIALARRNLNPSAPAKFAIGVILMGSGFLVMAAAASIVAGGSKVLPTWLILTYLLHTFGELCLSPVGLSYTTKLAPKRFVGQLMGMWFLSLSLGNLAGRLDRGPIRRQQRGRHAGAIHAYRLFLGGPGRRAPDLEPSGKKTDGERAMTTGVGPAPQLTFKAILLSIILTVILASANAYVGLFAGITVATAIPAAVISMAVLPLFGRSNILENNIVATGASAGTSISAGAIFTLPALILLHHWNSFDYWWTLAIVGLGGLLGVLFSVPLRRTLIIEQKLRFPEGIAAAEVLKVGANPGVGAKVLGLATVVGGLFKFITSGLRSLPEAFTAQRLHRRARHRVFRLWILAGIARRGLHRRPECRHSDRRRRLVFVVARHSDLQQLLLRA